MATYRYGYRANVSSARLSDQERSDVHGDLMKVVWKRRQLPKLEIEDHDALVYSCYDPEIIALVNIIQSNPMYGRMIHRDKTPKMHLLGVDTHAELRQSGVKPEQLDIGYIGLKCHKPVPAFRIKGWGNDDVYMLRSHPRFVEVFEYLMRSEDTLKIEAKVGNSIRHVLETCNTWGQVMRVWPEVINFMVHQGKKKVVENQTKKSALPDYYKNATVLDETRKELQYVNAILTQSLLLPEYKGDDSYGRNYAPDFKYSFEFYESVAQKLNLL